MPAMGANAAKSDLDQRYRDLTAAFLKEVMRDRGLNKTQLAKALGVDRTVASRYLSLKVRAPLQRLGYLYHSIKVATPRELETAFYDSEPSLTETPGQRA